MFHFPSHLDSFILLSSVFLIFRFRFFGLRGLSDFVRCWIGAKFTLCDGVRLTLY